MKFAILCSALLAWAFLVVTVEAQQVQVRGTGTQLRGQVVSVGNGQFVVRGPNNQNMTFYTNQQTKYYTGSQAAQWSAIQPGATVNTWYAPAQTGQTYVNTVAVVPADAQPAQPAQPAPAADANVYKGEVVRVVGQDQVVIRTTDGKEVSVYVNPQTTYQLNNQPATISQFQAGVPVEVNYTLRDGRPYARGILGRRR
jgi:hypothetical protein